MVSSAKEKVARVFAHIASPGHEGIEDIYDRDCCTCLAMPFAQTDRRLGTRELASLNDAYHRAFPKIRFEIDQVLEDGNKIVARWSVIAEPSPELVEPLTQLLIRPATDCVRVEGISFYRFRDGRVAEAFHLQDELGLLLQLGVDPGALPVVDFEPEKAEFERCSGNGTESDQKRFIREFMARVVNEKDEARREAAADEFLAADMQLFGPDAGNVDSNLKGIEKFTGGHRKYRRAFPDFDFATLDIVEEENFVALRWAVLNAWHTGPLRLGDFELPPTGNNANVHGAAVCEIVNGKIVSIWQLTDSASLLRQLMS